MGRSKWNSHRTNCWKYCSRSVVQAGKRTEPAGTQGERKKEKDATWIRIGHLKLNANCRLLGRERRKYIRGLGIAGPQIGGQKEQSTCRVIYKKQKRGVLKAEQTTAGHAALLWGPGEPQAVLPGASQGACWWRDHPDNILKNGLYHGQVETAASKKSPL